MHLMLSLNDLKKKGLTKPIMKPIRVHFFLLTRKRLCCWFFRWSGRVSSIVNRSCWISGFNYCFFNASPATSLAAARLAHTGSLSRSLATILDVGWFAASSRVTLSLKGMLLAWWISPYLVRGLKLMNRLDQLELHKAMAMELKWVLSKVLSQPARLPMPRAQIDSYENRSS